MLTPPPPPAPQPRQNHTRSAEPPPPRTRWRPGEHRFYSEGCAGGATSNLVGGRRRDAGGPHAHAGGPSPALGPRGSPTGERVPAASSCENQQGRWVAGELAAGLEATGVPGTPLGGNSVPRCGRGRPPWAGLRRGRGGSSERIGDGRGRTELSGFRARAGRAVGRHRGSFAESSPNPTCRHRRAPNLSLYHRG